MLTCIYITDGTKTGLQHHKHMLSGTSNRYTHAKGEGEFMNTKEGKSRVHERMAARSATFKLPVHLKSHN